MLFPDRGEIKELNEVTRNGADGSFIKLSNGVTHYELDGPQNGQPVVLVHGFSVPYFIFDPTFEALTEAGLRVLRYDLFGRGWSDRPRAKYNINLFVKQLEDLLEALQFQHVNLIGLSMGGPIAASFTARHPERIDKLVLIDPAGARPIALSVLLKAAKLPLVGELALGLFGSENMVKSSAADFFDPALIAEFQSKYKVQMQFKGFKHAILSTMRSGMLDSFIEIYRCIGELNQPTLLIWGRNDKTVPFAHSRDICEAIPQADLRVIEEGGHIPHYEKPDIVNTILLQFLT